MKQVGVPVSLRVCTLFVGFVCVGYAALGFAGETSDSVETTARLSSKSGIVASIWGGVGVAARDNASGGRVQPGPSLGGMLAMQGDWGMPLTLGLDAGLSTWNNPSGDGSSATNRVKIHLLPSAYYAFESFRILTGEIYLGASLGPVVYWQRYDGTGPRRFTRPALGLAALIRPGISFRLSQETAIGLELPVGISAGDWTASAQLKFSFALEAGRNSIGATENN